MRERKFINPFNPPLEELLDMMVGERFLDRPASWSAEEGVAVPMRKLIASRFPESAAQLGILFDSNPGIRRVSELSDEELKAVMIEEVKQGSDDEIMTDINGRIYTKDWWIEEIKSGGKVGSLKFGMEFVEKMLEAGKVHLGEDNEIRLPDFDF